MDQGITLDGGGLSPLARGTHSHGDRRRTVDRFIPAGAGNTNGDSLARSSFAVYSRWRGEHLTLAENGFSVRGLSPLARGTQPALAHAAKSDRFIPAGAGNTINDAAISFSCAVYPRWRGEHIKLRCFFSVTLGLSPLARGTLLSRSLTNGKNRFIPAGAGNTLFRRRVLSLDAVYPRWRGEHTKHT